MHRGGVSVYDQRFHEGVNIIHGENGSGKSTIMDFMFYALGGEGIEWKEHAALCDAVTAEVQMNDLVLTLRREVSTERQRPMQIFFGGMDEAAAHGISGWQTFPFRRSESRLSFSQVLFRALRIPEAQTAEGGNITMHQLMRLLYVDQMSPVQRIFRFESFDPPIMKQTVGDLLCGVGGYDLYERQVALRELEKKYSAISSELKSIATLLADFEGPLRLAALRKEYEELVAERADLYSELSVLERQPLEGPADAKQVETQRRSSWEELSKLRCHVQQLETDIKTLEFEVEDSHRFIKYLESTLRGLEQSTLTYQELGTVQFEYCPACFSPIAAHSSGFHCHLCKEELPDEDRNSRTLAIKLDLQMQLREFDAAPRGPADRI